MENSVVSITISRDELYRRILLQLFRHEEIQFNALFQEIGVERSVLTQALNFLEAHAFIHPLQKDQVEGNPKVSLRKTENCVIGLDLGGTKLYGAISNLGGDILHEEEIQNHGKSGEECFQMVEGVIDDLIKVSHQKNLRLLGIGIDVPGRVQLETGVVINAPAVSMQNFPLKDRVVSRFGYPTFIDNDLKQASLGEAWFGAGKNFRNVVLLAIGTGIAAGVVIDGVPLRGAHMRFGELGWMVPGREFLRRKYVGFGALEVEASGPGIEKRARKFMTASSGLGSLEEVKSEAVFMAARQGKDWAEKCVAETVDYLAILIANIMAFYDPDVIILSGGVSGSSDLLIPPIQKLVEGCVLTQPHITVSSLGYRAAILGAMINLVQNCPDVIR